MPVTLDAERCRYSVQVLLLCSGLTRIGLVVSRVRPYGRLCMSRLIKLIVVKIVCLAALTAQAAQFKGRDVSQVAVSPDGTLFASAGTGMFRSTDTGRSWSLLPGLADARLGEFAFGPDGKVFVMVNGFVLRSTDKGSTFQKMGEAPRNKNGFPLPNSISYIDKKLFADSDGLVGSSDDGKTWRYISKKFNGDRIVREPGGKLFLASGLVVSSTDHGKTWKTVALKDTVRHLALRDDGTLFAGVEPADLENISYIWTSGDKGNTWTRLGKGLPDSWGSQVRDLAAGRNGMMYAAVTAKVFVLAPGANAWVDKSRGLPGSKECALKGSVLGGVNSLALAPNGDLFAGTRHGVFVSHDQGGHWVPSLVLDTGF